MKKSIIALFAAATMVTGVNAQDNAGGTGTAGLGGVGVGGILTGAVVLGVAVGISNNNSADDPGQQGPGPGPGPEPTCEGDDPLVDGVCVGTTNTLTNTVTVSGTQTVTQTITVPVTFTYTPTVQ
ncbi:hypothetical protein [Alteromonas sp. A079]|uniref:hypothetical protein n=1 Tax=Alteromonas sp. A079 TaxID=3410268 RepID=UPI003B9F54D0